jgi:hypothetical protein
VHAYAVVEELLQAEQRLLELYRTRASEEPDPGLRRLLEDLLSARKRYFARLEEWRRSVDATEAITRQINDLYR